MASRTEAPAGDEAAPELVRLAASDVGARAPGRWTERLAIHLKGAVILAAVVAVAVAINRTPVSATSIVITSALALLRRVFAAGGLAVAVSTTVLIRRLGAKVSRFLPGSQELR